MHLLSAQNLQGFVLQALAEAFGAGGGGSLMLAGRDGRALAGLFWALLFFTASHLDAY